MDKLESSAAPSQPHRASVGDIIGPSLLMAGLSVAASALSFCYQLMVARRFGAWADMDAYLAAMAIRNWLVGVLIASLNCTLVPVFVERMVAGAQSEAWRIANGLLRLVLVALLTLCLAGMVFAPRLLLWLAPGLTASTRQEAVTLLRILLPSIVFSGAVAIFASVCYALRRFAAPSHAAILYVAVNMGVLWILEPSCGIRSIAWGTTIGDLSQALFLLPGFLSSGQTFLRFGPCDRGVRQVLKLMAPLIVIGLISRSTEVIERFFASGLPEGSISYLAYAMKILTPLSAIVVTAVITALFPLMAQEAARARRGLSNTLREIVAQGFGFLFFVTMPVAAWLAVLRLPLITLILQRGAFDHAAAAGTAGALLYYLGHFVVGAVAIIFSRAYYVLNDTATPAKVSAVAIIIYVALCALLVGPLSFGGPAMALSVYSLGVAGVLGWLVSRRLGGLCWSRIALSMGRTTCAAGVLAAVTTASWRLAEVGHLGLLPGVLIASGTGVAGYLLTAFFLRSDEMLTLGRCVVARLTRWPNGTSVEMQPVATAQVLSRCPDPGRHSSVGAPVTRGLGPGQSAPRR